MSINPWPLICFTLLIQMSVGCFIISETAGLILSRRFSSEALRLLRLYSRILVLVLSCLAGALCFLHVTKPWRSLRTLNNLEFSWLSREIFCLFCFILIVAAGAIFERRRGRGQSVWLLMGGLSGFFLVVAMFRLYMLPTVPVWNHYTTPSIFLLVCILLGTQLMAASWTFYLKKSDISLFQEIRTHWNQKILVRIENLSLVVAVILILLFLLLFVQNPAYRNKTVLSLFRLGLLLCGILLLLKGWIPVRPSSLKNPPNHQYVYIVFIVLLLAEILGRYLFYAVYFRLGL